MELRSEAWQDRRPGPATGGCSNNRPFADSVTLFRHKGRRDGERGSPLDPVRETHQPIRSRCIREYWTRYQPRI